MALIDYFSELTFLRDGDSINFQKASCTLDGCVKIYSTRVDAVADETGRLLNGLIDGHSTKLFIRNYFLKISVIEGNFEMTGLNEESNFGQDSEEKSRKIQTAKKRPHKAVDTLAPNFEQLTMKNFELEFSMDPLFRKTCAEFDDSGVKGFLSSRLGFNGEMKLVFDSLDAVHIQELNATDTKLDADDPVVDVSGLLSKFGKDLVALEGRVISPTLSEYSFSKFSNPTASKLAKNLTETLNKLAVMSMSADRMDIDSDDDADGVDGDAGGKDDGNVDQTPFETVPFDDYDP